jgi:YD repeat-containing protein
MKHLPKLPATICGATFSTGRSSSGLARPYLILASVCSLGVFAIGQAQAAPVALPLTTYNGKPCPDRPGSAYPNEGTGICRGNLSVGVSLPTLGFSMIYNSQSNRNLGYGKGWAVSVDSMFEKEASQTTAWLYSGDGTPVKFALSATKWNAVYPVLFDKVPFNQSPSIILNSRVNGTADTYTKTTSPTSASRYAQTLVTSRQGTEVTITRTSTGQIQAIRNFFGQTNTFTYTSGYLSSITDYAGALYKFNYDASGNLIKVVNPDNSATTLTYLTGTSLLSSTTDVYSRTTSYDYFRPSSGSALRLITDYEGYQTSFGYTASDVTMTSFSTTMKETFSVVSGVTTINKLQDAVTSQTVYDAKNRITQSRDHFGLTKTVTYVGATPYPYQLAAADGTVTTYQYDINSLPIIVTVTRGAKSFVTNYSRDTFGNVTAVNHNGVTTNFVYDAKGNLSKFVDASAKTIFNNTYDPTTGLLTSAATLQGYQASYSYDASGHVTAATYPSGENVTRTVNALGQTLSASSSFNFGATLGYDSIGRVTSASSTAGDATNSFSDSTSIDYQPTSTGTTTTSKYNGTQYNQTDTATDLKGRKTSQSETVTP